MDYNELATHRAMIRDDPRSDAFRRAVHETVASGDVVVDVGAGTGLLSLFAAQAGAARVYAVEVSPIAASMAAQLAAVNGFGDVIRVVNQDVRHVTLPEPADVLVSEWMGSIGVDENMLGPVLWARDHLLYTPERIVPHRVTAVAAPVATPVRSDLGFFLQQPWGLDLSPLVEQSVHELLMMRRPIDPANLAAEPQSMWTTDLTTVEPASVREPYTANLRFDIERGGAVAALCCWFVAELSPSVTLSTAPGQPATHWAQLLLPLRSAVELAPSSSLEVRVTATSVGPGPLQLEWAASTDGDRWDTVATAGPAATPHVEAPEPQQFARSELATFFAELAIDPMRLAEFIADPDAVLDASGLDDLAIDAIRSRDENRISEALYRPAPDLRRAPTPQETHDEPPPDPVEIAGVDVVEPEVSHDELGEASA